MPRGGVTLTVGAPVTSGIQQRASVTSVTSSTFTVEGVIATGTPCQALSAARRIEGGVVQMWITARENLPPGTGCIQVQAHFPYTAVVDAPRSGGVRLRVVHDAFGGFAPPRTVLDTTFAVPEA
jgi:hypothetical protein